MWNVDHATRPAFRYVQFCVSRRSPDERQDERDVCAKASDPYESPGADCCRAPVFNRRWVRDVHANGGEETVFL